MDDGGLRVIYLLSSTCWHRNKTSRSPRRSWASTWTSQWNNQSGPTHWCTGTAHPRYRSVPTCTTRNRTGCLRSFSSNPGFPSRRSWTNRTAHHRFLPPKQQV